jgi:hypothetical protein
MKNYKMIAAVAGAGLALSAASSQAQVTIQLANNVGSAITFTGVGSGNTTFALGGFDVTSTSPNDGTLNGQLGTLSGGTGYSLVASSYSGPGTVQSVNISGTEQLSLDGLTATVGFKQLSSLNMGDVIDTTGVLNLTGISYSGTDASLLALKNDGSANFDVTFQGYTVGNLLALGTGATDTSSFSATIAASSASPVPEANTIVAGALMLLPLGIGAVRAIRKERTA